MPHDEVTAKIYAAIGREKEAADSPADAEYGGIRAELEAAAGRTQEDVSMRTGFKQTHVSRLEKRADMKLSTLGDYVESLG